ncbi:Chaperone protein fimC precursor [Klebsiella quasipneumoniae]|uniref:fimbrial biogenesis chaperone n=1 Tax=Klebsiella pneumoniae complex TaxID=3390273 RepID=UPI000D74D382|nr:MULTISPECIES: molecular chaperone [Klebsiella]EFD0440048.1 molecular chaperone [Escherichia coli]EGQ5302469.1 molecular chaperone [Enterobacter hormaechei]HBW7922054.1 molecular chaperone [Klebsiella pneumoniae]HCB1270075.1 molecular chaperone [Klebsiella quasipneumoniae subsp. quasipneumoniae]HDH7807526.1 molecular chaperone [Raoultella ornithinolytica]
MIKNLLLFSIFLSFAANANIIIDGTRIIFPSNKKEVSVRVTNVGDTPSLAQVWVDDGKIQNSSSNDKAPFIVLPPIIRIDPAKGQTFRLVYSGVTLPQDRESLYWFNLLDIPPEPKGEQENNYLQLSIRSRIKLFFRPSEIQTTENNPEKSLSWDFEGQREVISVKNSSPFFITIDSITINGEKVQGAMIPPFSKVDIKNTGRKWNSAPKNVTYTTINDYGALIKHSI